MASGSSSFAVQKIGADQLDAAVAVLQRAFAGDGALEALTAGLPRAAACLFRRSIEVALQRGGACYVAFDGADACGVAVALAPACEWRFHEDAVFMAELPDDVREWYAQHYALKHEELYLSCGASSADARRDAWTLAWLGVAPEHRRRGVGKALIQAVVSKAAETHTRTVVEVTNPQTVNLFQQCAFRYRAVKNLASRQYAGFPIWLLVRPPPPPAPPGTSTSAA